MAGIATSTDDVLVNDLIIEDYADQGLYGVKFFVMGRCAPGLTASRGKARQGH